jgi:hypothetical protein
LPFPFWSQLCRLDKHVESAAKRPTAARKITANPLSLLAASDKDLSHSPGILNQNLLRGIVVVTEVSGTHSSLV